MRFDLSSLGVMALAIASSLTAAFWLSHLGESGQARAEPLSIVSTAPAEGHPGQVLKAADGHYWAQAQIDGRAIPVMIDTGASVVVLTPEDARRLGYQLKTADFAATVVTASGPVKAARVHLPSVTVAGARVDAVQALVVEKGLPHSLLGMSYLGRLSAFEARPDALTLRP